MSNVNLSQIGQISINVHEVDRAVQFYRDKLGIKHLFTIPKMAFFDCAGINLMLAVPERPEFDHPSSIIYFNVDNIQEVFQTLLADGVKFEQGPQLVARMDTYDLWMAFFRDTENNALALMSKPPRSEV